MLLYTRSANRAIFLGVPTAVGIFLVAENIVTLIFGTKFAQAVPVLEILSFFLMLSVLRNVVSLFLTACNGEAARARSEWIGAGLGETLQVVLIPI